MGTHTNISIGGGNDGGSLAPTHNSWVEQTISLKDKSQMLEEEIQSGFTSTMSSDVWFWTTDTDTVTIKQTLVDNNNNSSTTNRIIEGTCATFNGCSYTNYTDSIVIGSSDATDYNITARVDVTDGGQSTGHAAPDVDDIELSVAYTKYEPISEDIQEDLDVIDDIDFDYEEIDFAIPEEIWTDVWTDFDDVFIEEEFFEEEFETIFLEEFEDFEDFEEFEEAAFEELEVPEEFESFFSEEFSDEEMEILEEEFADEFEEFADDVMDEVLDEEPTNKEVVKEDKEEVIEEETADEETEVAENKSEEETTEKIEEENDTIDTPEEETETEILTEEKEIDVAETKDNKINIEVNENVSVEVKQISLFDNGNELTAYQETDFYQPENIYADVDNALFIQADLSIYNQGIYINVGLDNYISTDPIGQHKKKLYEIKVNKIQLMIELNKLKELL